MKIDTYNTLNNKDASMNTIRKLVATILSLLLFNTATVIIEDPSYKEIDKKHFHRRRITSFVKNTILANCSC
jgi:hypothetical protein